MSYLLSIDQGTTSSRALLFDGSLQPLTIAKQEFTQAVRARTGLLLDRYFSATKLAWILDNVSGARQRAERGELAFGTIDSYLIWRLTGST